MAVVPMGTLGDMSADLPINLCANRAFGESQVEVSLQSEPALGRDAKVFTQSKRGIGTVCRLLR